MEKRGSGLLRIQTFTAALPAYSEGKQPAFESDNQMFYTIVDNVNYSGTSKSSHRSENVHIESSHKGEKGSHKGEKGSHKNSESSRKEQPKGSYKSLGADGVLAHLAIV